MRKQNIPNKIQKLADKTNCEVADFFGIEPIEYKIIIYKNKDELGKEWISHRTDGKQAPDWLVAFADYNQTVHLTSPNTMPATSTMTGPQRFQKTLKHELTHIYLRKINKNLSFWLNEGTALYVANQDYYKKINPTTITINTLKEIYRSGQDMRTYVIGKNIVDQIIDNYGKQKLLDIIKIKTKKELFLELQKMFDWLK